MTAAVRVGDEEDGVLVRDVGPELAGGIADGGLVAGAEGGADVGHAADEEPAEESSCGAGAPERLVGLEAGAHFLFEAGGGGALTNSRCTIQPVTANRSVMAMEVESMIFHSSESEGGSLLTAFPRKDSKRRRGGGG